MMFGDQTRADLRTCGAKGDGLAQWLKALWLNPAFLAVSCYRLSSRLYPQAGLKRLLARAIWRYALKSCGCDISPRSRIGQRFYAVHPIGVVIGGGCEIADDVTLYQNVTLGQKHDGGGFPVVKDRVTIYAGACVLGGVTIGEDAIIGANAVVLADVAAGQTVAGAPAIPVTKRRERPKKAA
ncbi:MAG: serine O-acetyltransferase [Bdellovibrionales bacterium]